MTSSPCFIVDDNCQITLQEVQQNNLPLKIKFHKWRLSKSFTCRILNMEEEIITLAIPILENESPIEIAQWESKVTICFNYNYQQSTFISQVMEEGPKEIKSGVMSQTILIARPQIIEAYPRRKHERISVSSGESIKVQMSGLDNITGQTRIIDKNLQGILHDISYGGIGVKVPQKVLVDVSVGDLFEICIAPVSNGEPLVLKALLCHVTELPKQGQMLLGFQFKEKLPSVKYDILTDKSLHVMS